MNASHDQRWQFLEGKNLHPDALALWAKPFPGLCWRHWTNVRTPASEGSGGMLKQWRSGEDQTEDRLGTVHVSLDTRSLPAIHSLDPGIPGAWWFHQSFYYSLTLPVLFQCQPMSEECMYAGSGVSLQSWGHGRRTFLT